MISKYNLILIKKANKIKNKFKKRISQAAITNQTRDRFSNSSSNSNKKRSSRKKREKESKRNCEI